MLDGLRYRLIWWLAGKRTIVLNATIRDGVLTGNVKDRAFFRGCTFINTKSPAPSAMLMWGNQIIGEVGSIYGRGEHD